MVRDFRFENGFGSVETIDSELKVMISFSAFFLWIEVVSFFVQQFAFKLTNIILTVNKFIIFIDFVSPLNTKYSTLYIN
jgi:hypothetical protein